MGALGPCVLDKKIISLFSHRIEWFEINQDQDLEKDPAPQCPKFCSANVECVGWSYVVSEGRCDIFREVSKEELWLDWDNVISGLVKTDSCPEWALSLPASQPTVGKQTEI